VHQASSESKQTSDEVVQDVIQPTIPHFTPINEKIFIEYPVPSENVAFVKTEATLPLGICPCSVFTDKPPATSKKIQKSYSR
jgi:hypothetical protein